MHVGETCNHICSVYMYFALNCYAARQCVCIALHPFCVVGGVIGRNMHGNVATLNLCFQLNPYFGLHNPRFTSRCAHIKFCVDLLPLKVSPLKVTLQ